MMNFWTILKITLNLSLPNKKSQPFEIEIFSARDRIRTSTPFPALPPQSSASTNFATRAEGIKNRGTDEQGMLK